MHGGIKENLPHNATIAWFEIGIATTLIFLIGYISIRFVAPSLDLIKRSITIFQWVQFNGYLLLLTALFLSAGICLLYNKRIGWLISASLWLYFFAFFIVTLASKFTKIIAHFTVLNKIAMAELIGFIMIPAVFLFLLHQRPLLLKYKVVKVDYVFISISVIALMAINSHLPYLFLSNA